jgi:cytoskeletal protein RodZ
MPRPTGRTCCEEEIAVSIGETLTVARERAGISVEQVAAATRLRQTLVRAIEHDDYALCGGDFYARGHIRNIARTVGVDPDPLVAEFDAAHVEEPAPRASEIFEAEKTRAERRGPNWSAAMAAVLVLVVVYGVVQALTGGSREDVGGPVAGSDDPTTGSSAPVSTSPTARSDPSAVAQAPRDRVTVQVLADGRSWVQATTANGKELFQGLLQPGEVRSFTDKTRIKLVVGNAGAVSLTVNGTKVGSPGRDGQVARVQFGPQDPAAG